MGRWKNFEELEESLSLVELDFIIKHKREDQHNKDRLIAALQGVDLDKGREQSVEERVEKVKRRAAIKLAGGEKELERQEFADLGFGFETI